MVITDLHILMATYNGANHIDEQLQSIAEQSYTNWRLWVSDDHSEDATCTKVVSFLKRHPQGNGGLFTGPGQGAAENFMSLLARHRPEGLVALADQDDVWFSDRLDRAVASLQKAGPGPAIYASRAIVTNADLVPGRISPLHMRGPSFGNALVQNILAGNTIVMNQPAAQLAHDMAVCHEEVRKVPHHDWWLYQLMTGIGATVICDPEPGLYYRQHGGNLLGAHRGFRRGISRLGALLSGEFTTWLDANLAALKAVDSCLTSKNRSLRDAFEAWRHEVGEAGRPSLKALGIRRQSRLGNALLDSLARAGRL